MSDTITAALIAAVVGLVVLWVHHRQSRVQHESKARSDSILNTPNLYVASVEAVNPFGSDMSAKWVRISLCNSGDYATTIRKGYVHLTSAKYPEAYDPKPLTGVQVSTSKPHVVEFPVKHGFMHPGGVEKPDVKVVCQASYERPGKPDGELNEAHEYDQQSRKFRKV